MGGGKGGSKKQKVPYYYMSLHYGIAHGPLDSINRITIKEKPVLGGPITNYGAYGISLPELFGGETKEGGVSGTIETYLGTFDQTASHALAERHGRTVDSMPGYRGVASLFFRGFVNDEVPVVSSDNTSPDINVFLSGAFGGSGLGGFGGLGGSSVPVTSTGQKGFLWAVNNPYLAAAAVNVTRIGRPVDPILASVRPAPAAERTILGLPNAMRIFPNDTLAFEPYPAGKWTVQSVAHLSDSIDSGEARIMLTIGDADDVVDGGPGPDYGAYSTKVGLRGPASGSHPESQTLQIAVRAFDGDGNPLVVKNDVGLASGSITRSATTSATLNRKLPIGTRTIHYTSRSVIAYAPAASAYRIRSGISVHLMGPRLTEEGFMDGQPQNMNPAHIILECLTNRQWGMGAPMDSIDLPAIQASAATLKAENFGLSMMWREQTSIEKFVSEVLDHIQGMLFLSPKTGLWKHRLIRGDYDPASLRVLDESNCEIRNRQRKGQGDLINEIIIQYKDFQTEKDKTVTFHDIAGIAQLGQIVSDTRPYYGCRDEGLANFLGARDIRSSAYPLFSADIEADRTFRDVEPGDVLKLNIADDGIVGMVVRVGKVNYGAPGSRKVRFAVTEDVFALKVTSFTTVGSTLWEDTNPGPRPLQHQRMIEVPFPLLLRSGFDETDLPDTKYPEVVTAVFAEDRGRNIISASIWGNVTLPNGDTVQQDIGEVIRLPGAPMGFALAAEASTQISSAIINAIMAPEQVSAGDFFYVDGTNETGEFVMLDSLNVGTGLWTVARGIFDTVPRAHPIGTVLWYIGSGLTNIKVQRGTAGMTETYKLLPRSQGGRLNPSQAVPLVHTPNERPYAPHRPAAGQLDGNGFGNTFYSSNDPGGIPVNVTATWRNRNRLMEDGQAPRWNDANVTPEVGQTTTLRIVDSITGIVEKEYTGITGTTFNIVTDDLQTYRFYSVQFIAERDGFESIQFTATPLELERLGYGNNYGFDYGENDGS